MEINQRERKKEAEHLKAQLRDIMTPPELDSFVKKLCTNHVIKPQPQWAIYEDGIGTRAAIVQKWQIVNIIDTDKPMCFLFSDMLISDYKHRGKNGDYVFTSLVDHFDIERGLVRTKNSLYCLKGKGEEVNATLIEVIKMRAIKQPLQMVRAIERNIGPIQDLAE
ncbi:MAG: DUF6957 family protein [Pseudomonadota bacterium]